MSIRDLVGYIMSRCNAEVWIEDISQRVPYLGWLLGKRAMAALIKTLVKIVGFLTQRNLALFLTYFYIITFLVLMKIHKGTEEDLSWKDKNTELLVKRSLNVTKQKLPEVRRAFYKNGAHIDVKKDSLIVQNKEVKDENVVELKQEPALKPDAEVGQERSKQVTQIEHAESVNRKKSQEVKKDIKTPKSKTADVKTNQKKSTRYPNVEKIPNFKFNTTPPVREDTWQNIMADQTYLIFAAFYERSYGQPFVRNLVMNGNTYMPRFYCELTFYNDVIETVKGLKPWMLPDHHEKQYKTLFLYCPLPDERVPKYVSIIPVIEPVRLHRLPVIYHPKEERNFTVCLSPMFFNYSIEHELVQWIELNRLIGADLFIIYNYTTVGRTDEILNHYVKEGWVKVIQWKLPEHTDLHYYGQVSMMNDCLFRNYKVSKYMVNIDIDELIIPRQGIMKWNDLMTSLPHDKCEFSFRSTIMAAESKNVFEGKQKARELNLHFLLRMERREYIFDKNVRSKYIVNTTCIDTVGIHFCWKYRNGTADTERYHVPPRSGLMFHFRTEPVAKKGKEIEEKAVYKYHTQLIENARKRWEKINAEKHRAKT